MNMPTTTRHFLFAAALAFAASPANAQEKISYETHVQPILLQRCGRCHNEEKQKAGLIATTYAGVTAGSSGGVVVVAGEPEQSNLYLAITHRRDPTMPPGNDKIPQNEIDTIKKWIEGGLLENGGSKPKPKKKRSGPDLKAAIVTLGKPAEPPPPPKDLLLEPVVTSVRPGALESMAANPWAPLVALGGQQQILLVALAPPPAAGAAAPPPELVGILPFPEGLPQCLAFSRDGRTLIASGGRGATSGRVVGWNVADGRRRFELGAEDDSILAADLSPDQKFVAFGTTDKLVKVVTSAGDAVHQLKKHTDWVTAVAYSPDGVLLATGDRNGNLYVWEAASGREYQTLAGHTAAITGLAWRDDANLLASSSEDGTIRLWEMQEGKQLKNWAAHGGGALCVAFAHDGRLASSGRDHAVKIWKGDGALEKQCDGLTDIALRVAFDHEGKQVVAGDWNGVVKLWNAADGKVVGDVTLNSPKLADRLAAAKRRVAETQPTADAATQARATAEANAKEPLAQLATAKALVDAATQHVKEGETALAALPAADPNAVISADERARRDALVTERKTLHAQLAESAAAVRAAAQQSPNDAALQQSAADSEQAAAHAQQAVEAAEQSLAAVVKAAEDARRRGEAEAAVAAAKAELEPKSAEAARLAAESKPFEEALAAAQKNETTAVAPWNDALHQVARWQAAEIDVEWHHALDELATAEADRDAKAAVAQSANESLESARAAVAAAEKELADAPQRLADRAAAIASAQKAASDATASLQSAQALAQERAAPLAALESSAADLHARAGKASDDPELAAAAKCLDDALAHMKTSVATAQAAVDKQRSAADAAIQQVAAAEKSRADEEARTAALPKTIDELRTKLPPAEQALAAANEAVAATAPLVDAKRSAAAEIEKRYRERLAARS